MRVSQLAIKLGIIGAITLLGGVTATSAKAQCSNGNCGNVGVADAYGGYSSVGYGAGGGSIGSGSGFQSPTSGSQWGHRHVQPLFDNYFTQGNANRADAALYVSPVGVPGWVGHTYNTYQPLYPHHFLYQHDDRYHSYYDQGFGLNRTKAAYIAPPARSAIKYVARKLEVPR